MHFESEKLSEIAFKVKNIQNFLLRNDFHENIFKPMPINPPVLIELKYWA